MPVTIKTAEEIAQMRIACRKAAQVLEMIEPHVQAGVTTAQLDQLCHDYITQTLGCTPAPLNYRGFPKSICTSINHQVCHGIPDDRPLKDGDIINVDITVIHEGFHGDTSRMFMIGTPSIQARRVVDIAHEALWRGIQVVRAGAHLGDIGHAIQRYAEAQRCSVVREYCGHGIGRAFHEDPQVLHFGQAGSGLQLESGMIFTIEPMINAGKRHTKILADGWTVVTKDRSPSAQWEHTVLVTDSGCDVLTLRSDEQAPTA